MNIPTVALEEIAEVRLGRQRSPKNHVGAHMRPYVRAANVSWAGWKLDDVKTMNFTDQEMDTYRLHHGDLLLGEASGSASEVGKPALWEGQIDDCAFQNTLIRVRPSDAVDSRYLLRYFGYCAASGQFARSARGVGIFHLGSKALAEWEVPLPPIEEQRRIAAVLDAADRIRAKRRESLAKLDTITQAIFIDMFGPAGSAGELMALGDALADAEVFTDGDWVESKDQDPTGEVRLIQLADIGVGTWLDKSERYMNRATADRLKCTFLEPGDVLVARMPDPIGRACIFPGERRPSVTAVDVCIIRPNRERLDARWLVEALNLPRTQSEIARRATGSTRSRVSRRNLAKVELAVPPLDVQREFAARASEVERGRSAHVGSYERVGDLFSSLQQRAFRGEL